MDPLGLDSGTLGAAGAVESLEETQTDSLSIGPPVVLTVLNGPNRGGRGLRSGTRIQKGELPLEVRRSHRRPLTWRDLDAANKDVAY
jgi:hypothetical protein